MPASTQTKMRGVRSDWRHRLRKFASSFQVELQGNYSAQRLAALQQYVRSTSSYRALLISTLSPFPCLLILTLIDVAPLAPPEAGSSANYMFWIRDFLTIALMTRAILEQFRLSVPGMQINTAQIVVMPIIASAGAIAFMLAMASVIGFPLPFALVVGITVWFAVLVVCFACFFGRVLRQNAFLRNGLLNYSVVLVCQVLLTFIYPAYLYGFIRTGSSGQMFYVILLPVIKIVAKNWISYFLGTNFDLKPQIMVFNVDVFNALYVASSMQNSNTITTILEMIALDVVLAWISISDINRLVKGVKTLQLQIPIDHPLKSANFMEIALQLIEEDPREREQLSMRRCSSNLMAFER